MARKIFITGISSSLMRKLSSLIDTRQFEVIGLSRNSNIAPIKNIKIIQGDLKNIKQFSHHLKNCELIIHAAGITHSFNEQKYYQTNLNFTKKLVDKAIELNARKFIFISSNTANKENGAYANSKLLAENYIKKTSPNYTIIRISEIFGGDNKEGIEKLVQTTRYNLFAFCPKGMSSKFSPIHINDAIKNLYSNIFLNPQINKTIGINGCKKYTFEEILKLIKRNKKGKLFIFNLNKKSLFLIYKLTKNIPFYIGFAPDQIMRLYGIKSYNNSTKNHYINFEDYVANILNK